MDLNKPVSGRELARLTGQTEGAVRKAKIRGSILKGVNEKGKFIPAIACKEWGKPILKEFLNSVTIKKPAIKKPTVKKPIPKPEPIKKIPKPKSISLKAKKEPETADEFIDEIMNESLPRASADDMDDESVTADLSGIIEKSEAERITSVLKAKILQISYNEKKGELVPIDKVNSVLFGYGQEIRNSMESIPDRVIDRILAVADKRHEARRILADEIQDTLELLADVTTRKFV
jgi:phage terminase Nu1 subunit (DNA packaging protein)